MPVILGFSPTQWANYETGVSKPRFEDLTKIADYFEVSLDELVYKDLSNVHLKGKKEVAKKRQNVHLNVHPSVHLNEKNSSSVNEPSGGYFTGKMPSIVTVDQGGIDNILYVPIKAQAGYLIGYGDHEFIETLPSFRMPGLTNKTYRMFEVQGVSMSPTLSHGDRVICEWVPSIDEIRENRVHVIIHEDGVRIKRVLNRAKERGVLYLKSDTVTNRSDYPLLEVTPGEIKEIWYVRMKVSLRPP